MANTTRTTISVSNALKARMDKVKEAVNWSAVACDAFERKLDEIQARKEVRKMNDVIERLRASKRQSAGRLNSRAKEAGREWAMRQAEASHLERLALLKEKSGYDWGTILGGNEASAYTAAQDFYFIIDPESDGSRNTADNYWEEILGDDWSKIVSKDGYILGFAEGALEVWSEVKGKL